MPLPSIAASELIKLKETENQPLLIDVREQDEWDEGHIDWATHIPMGVLEAKIGEIAPDTSVPIVMQCRSGGRSGICTRMLIDNGYTNVKNLEGGYLAYLEANN